jgi:hypothetical protein
MERQSQPLAAGFLEARLIGFSGRGLSEGHPAFCPVHTVPWLFGHK